MEMLQVAAVFPQSEARNERGACEEVEVFQTSSHQLCWERALEKQAELKD